MLQAIFMPLNQLRFQQNTPKAGSLCVALMVKGNTGKPSTEAVDCKGLMDFVAQRFMQKKHLGSWMDFPGSKSSESKTEGSFLRKLTAPKHCANPFWNILLNTTAAVNS